MDRLEGGESKQELLELAESVRLQAMIFQHNVFYHRERLLERAASRYLDLLKSALLDEHYLENEVRLEYLADCIERKRTPDQTKLRDPVRQMKHETLRLENSRRAGRIARDTAMVRPFCPTPTWAGLGSRLSRDASTRFAATASRGSSSTAGPVEEAQRSSCADTSTPTSWPIERSGWPTPSGSSKHGGAGLLDLSADLNIVRDGFRRFDLLDDRVHFLQGPYRETLPRAAIDEVALLRIGAGLGEADPRRVGCAVREGRRWRCGRHRRLRRGAMSARRRRVPGRAWPRATRRTDRLVRHLVAEGRR